MPAARSVPAQVGLMYQASRGYSMTSAACQCWWSVVGWPTSATSRSGAGWPLISQSMPQRRLLSRCGAGRSRCSASGHSSRPQASVAIEWRHRERGLDVVTGVVEATREINSADDVVHERVAAPADAVPGRLVAADLGLVEPDRLLEGLAVVERGRDRGGFLGHDDDHPGAENGGQGTGHETTHPADARGHPRSHRMLLLFDGHACGPLAVPTGGRGRPYTGLSGSVAADRRARTVILRGSRCGPWGLRRASGVPTGATHRTWPHPSQSRQVVRSYAGSRRHAVWRCLHLLSTRPDAVRPGHGPHDPSGDGAPVGP